MTRRPITGRGQGPQRGVIALITVLLIGAFVMSLGIATASIGQTGMLIESQLDMRNVLMQTIASCLDEATYRLKLNAAYTGGSVPIDVNTCTLTVSGSGTTRALSATATADIYTKTVTATATQKQNTAANAVGWSLGAWTEADPP